MLIRTQCPSECLPVFTPLPRHRLPAPRQLLSQLLVFCVEATEFGPIYQEGIGIFDVSSTLIQRLFMWLFGVHCLFSVFFSRSLVSMASA